MGQLVCPSIVGRNGELADLDAALAAARDGRGRMVIVSGEAGIGKSRLAGEVAERARAAGMRVLTGRATQMGTPVPYRPFAEAMQSGLRDAVELHQGSLDPYRHSLRRLLPEVSYDPVDQGSSPVVLMEGILRLLAATAEARGVLLVLEDLQWADADTLAVVEYLADHVAGVGVLCLCTERADSVGAAAELVGSLTARRAAERILLLPLSEEDVAVMAGLILGDEDVPAGVVQALGPRAAGVPFLVEETLAAYLAAGGPAERTPAWWVSRRIAAALPPSYRQVVDERLAVLDDAARKVVQAAAVVGPRFDWRLLARITDLDEDVVVAKLRAADVSGLITSRADHYAVVFEFRHALAREAVLAAMFAPQRAKLSLRAAAAIEAAYPGLPGEWCQRAADLYEQGGERLRACGVLLEAAQRAVSRSAFRSAEGILAHARELAEDDWMVWMQVDDLLLDVHSQTGQTERILELGYGLIDVFQGRYRGAIAATRLAALHLRIARGIAPGGDWALVRRELAEAARLAVNSGDPALTARVAAFGAEAALASGHAEQATELAAEAERSARRLGLGDVLCEALDAKGRAVSRAGDGVRAAALFARCERAAVEHGLPLWRVRALLELGSRDSLVRAELGRLDEARALAQQLGAVSTLAAIELELGWGRLGRAELDAAAEAIARSLDLSRPHRLGLMPVALAAQCMLHALRNEPEPMERAAVEALKWDDDPIVEARVIGNGAAVLSLARGDESAALELLDSVLPVAEAATDWTVSWLSGLAALLHAADGTARPRAGPVDPLTAAYRAYARAVTLGREAKGEAAIAAMVEADGAIAPGWRRAHARLVVARCAFENGWGDPDRWLRESLAFLDATPLAQFAAAAKAALRRAGAPVPRRGRGSSPVPAQLQELGVTTREMDVLHLVGERLSNTEIGRRLYLSARTVEGHVASLRRKLDAADRTELVELARRHAAA